jgi:hypothetical protein
MTIEEFRRHKFLPAEWSKLLRTNGILQSVLQTMEENHPARYAIIGDRNEDVSPVRAGIELGMTRGYSKYGDTLRLLARPIAASVSIGEPSYEPPAKPEELTNA